MLSSLPPIAADLLIQNNIYRTWLLIWTLCSNGNKWTPSNSYVHWHQLHRSYTLFLACSPKDLLASWLSILIPLFIQKKFKKILKFSIGVKHKVFLTGKKHTIGLVGWGWCLYLFYLNQTLTIHPSWQPFPVQLNYMLFFHYRRTMYWCNRGRRST